MRTSSSSRGSELAVRRVFGESALLARGELTVGWRECRARNQQRMRERALLACVWKKTGGTNVDDATIELARGPRASPGSVCVLE